MLQVCCQGCGWTAELCGAALVHAGACDRTVELCGAVLILADFLSVVFVCETSFLMKFLTCLCQCYCDSSFSQPADMQSGVNCLLCLQLPVPAENWI